MSQDTPQFPVHPAGEQPPIEQETSSGPATLDTWAGPVRVEWDSTAPLTPFGQLPFFIEYLKVSNLFDALVADCPLTYTSPNAPEKRDVLGTTMLSVLAGHKRYAHITALRNDGVLPELLGMKKIVSEDAVRRGFKAIGEVEGREWLQRHLDYCTAPLLSELWVLDMDSTVKPLYGHQEGAVLGYNPKKPGRPSHVYHTDAGQGWQGREDKLRLEGWSRQRQVVILRRRLKEGMAIAGCDGASQLALSFVEIGPGADAYEYGVLVLPWTRRF